MKVKQKESVCATIFWNNVTHLIGIAQAPPYFLILTRVFSLKSTIPARLHSYEI